MNEGLEGFFDKNLKLPVYHQIYLTLKDWILSGRIAIGAQLPTEAALCKTFDVSRITIRKAVDLLKAENLVSREQGRGTFVTESVSSAPFTEEMSRLLARLARMVERTEIADLRIGETQVGEDSRLDLGLSAGARVTEISFVRLSKGTRIGSALAHVPSDLGLNFAPDEIAKKSLLELFEDKGVDLASADQLIGATLADPQNAARLQIAVGAPLVEIRLVANDRSYRPVLRMVANFRADSYRHHIHLVRRPDESGASHWMQSPA